MTDTSLPQRARIVIIGGGILGCADRTDFVIEVYGEPIPAVRHDRPLYDPGNGRLKA